MHFFFQFLASLNGHSGCVKRLLEASILTSEDRINIKIKTKDGWTPILIGILIFVF